MDFQCPACQTVAEQVVKPLIQAYVADGTVRFAYRFFPFLGPESVCRRPSGVLRGRPTANFGPINRCSSRKKAPATGAPTPKPT